MDKKSTRFHACSRVYVLYFTSCHGGTEISLLCVCAALLFNICVPYIRIPADILHGFQPAFDAVRVTTNPIVTEK